jgi:hypothetical protein
MLDEVALCSLCSCLLLRPYAVSKNSQHVIVMVINADTNQTQTNRELPFVSLHSFTFPCSVDLCPSRPSNMVRVSDNSPGRHEVSSMSWTMLTLGLDCD